jgi:hypothetical protein
LAFYDLYLSWYLPSTRSVFGLSSGQ